MAQVGTEQTQSTRFNTSRSAYTPVIGIIMLEGTVELLKTIITKFARGLIKQIHNNEYSSKRGFEFNSEQSCNTFVLDIRCKFGQLRICHVSEDRINEDPFILVDEIGNSVGWKFCATTQVGEIKSWDKMIPGIDSDATLRLFWGWVNEVGNTTVLEMHEGPDA